MFLFQLNYYYKNDKHRSFETHYKDSAPPLTNTLLLADNKISSLLANNIKQDHMVQSIDLEAMEAPF